MEKKDQIPQVPPNPEKESFEKYTRKNPDEIKPQEVNPKQSSEQQFGSGDTPGGRRQYPNVAEDEQDQQDREGYAANRPDAGDARSTGQQEVEGPATDEADLYEEENVEENKSPLRPIDANRTPEEWKNLQHNQPDVVEDKRDYDAVSM